MELSERQQQILDVAIDLIAEQGIQHLTIRRIGEHVGISEPAIYRHFASKTEILLVMLDSLGLENSGIFQRAAEDAGSVIEEIGMILNAFFTRFATRPAVAAVIFAEEIFRNDHRLVQKLESIRIETGSHLLRIVEQGQESGELRRDVPAKQMHLMIVGSLRLLVLQWRAGGCTTDLVVEGRELTTTLTKLLR